VNRKINALTLFSLSLRWTDGVMWYLFWWRIVYGTGRLPVWRLPPNEERKQVCALASDRKKFKMLSFYLMILIVLSSFSVSQ